MAEIIGTGSGRIEHLHAASRPGPRTIRSVGRDTTDEAEHRVPTVWTVGHGTLAAGAFAELVAGAGLEHVVDVRSYPGSRRHPHFGREEMERWLPEARVGYSWLRELGGRRRPVPHSEHVALRNDSFRAYADHMETDDFRAGVTRLVDLARGEQAAVMCSESLWWNCHRRLLADHLVLLDGVDVLHLAHDGRLTPHAPTDGVRVDGDRLVYDVGVPRELPET
jgi:uncharacterized protein (DUF488 family)